jgi:hypothetical protein
MGCHTWFYKKINSPLDEEIKKTVIERCSKELDFLERLINDRGSIDADFLEAYPEFDSEWVTNNKSFWLDLKERTENGTIETDELYERYCDWSNDLTEHVKDKGWFIECDEFHDVFRKYGYPDDKLFSYQETMDYINDPKNECVVYDHTDEHLKRFWDKHPDGLILFG